MRRWHRVPGTFITASQGTKYKRQCKKARDTGNKPGRTFSTSNSRFVIVAIFDSLEPCHNYLHGGKTTLTETGAVPLFTFPSISMEFNMASKLVVLSLLVILVNGCSLSPNYRADGPCKWFHKYPELCEAAAANAAVIGKVEVGQTFAEVRKVMGRDAERRQATESQETWEYITNYDYSRYSIITFVDGKVTSIKQ